MAVAGICALLAIGFAIWAITSRSDANDANAKAARQQRTIERQRRQIARNLTIIQQVTVTVQRSYDRLRRDLGSAAPGAPARRTTARLRAEAALAATCVRRAVNALAPILSSPNPRQGLDAARARLRRLETTCGSVAP
jgi:hypothetical protein